MGHVRSAGLALSSSLALMLLAAAPALATPAPLDVWAHPHDPNGQVEITLPDQGTSTVAQIHIHLREFLPERRDPRFSLSPLTAVEPSYAQPPAHVSMAVVVNGRDVTNGGFHPHARGTFAAELRLSGIDTFGTFGGDLLAGIGSAPMAARVHLVIRRYPAPELRLGGFAKGIRTVNASSSTVEFPLEVLGSNIATAEDVTLEVDTPRTDDGSDAAVEIVEDAIPTRIVGLGTGRRVIRLTLPAPGTYTAPVRLSWNGAPHDYTLRVDWRIGELGVAVLAVQGATGEVPTCVLVPGRPHDTCSTTGLWISLQETAGRRVVIDAPTLRSLVKKEGNTEFAAPGISLATSLDCVGVRGIQLSASSPSTIETCGRASYDRAADSLTLEPGAIARLRMQVLGDVGAGEYVAQLELSGDATKTIGSEASLFFRLPAIAASGVFLLGCLIALPIRLLLTTGRRRRDQRARLAADRRRLDKLFEHAPEGEPRDAVAAVRREAARVAQSFGWHGGSGRDARRRIDDLELRGRAVERWLAVWADSALLSEGPRNRVRSRLESLARTLGSDQLLDTNERRALAEIDSLEEHLAAISVARTSSGPRDPRNRRREPSGSNLWWQLRGSAIRAVQWVPWLETLILVVLATLGGLAFLWAPNPTWGSVQDLLTAVLWSIAIVLFWTIAFSGTLGARGQLERLDTPL